MNPEISNIKKLVRKNPEKGWWFTVIYDTKWKDNDGTFWSHNTLDSYIFNTYSECRKACTLWVKENL